MLQPSGPAPPPSLHPIGIHALEGGWSVEMLPTTTSFVTRGPAPVSVMRSAAISVRKCRRASDLRRLALVREPETTPMTFAPVASILLA